MNINMSDFFKNNISSGSQTTDVNVSENLLIMVILYWNATSEAEPVR